MSDYKSLVGNNYLEETNIDKNTIINSIDSSKIKGYWFDSDTIQKYFDQIVIVCNDKKLYNNILLCDDRYNDYLKDIYIPKEEYQAYYISSNNNEKNTEATNINNNEKESTNIDIIFEPYIEQLYK